MITVDPPSSLSPDPPAISVQALARFLRRARTAVCLHGPVDVLLTTDGAMRRLNRSFRGEDKTTDVLSFPAPPEIAARCAGDLAVSLPMAAKQALRFGHSLEVEVRVLVLHGLLHLRGMDHETDRGEMAAEEARLRTKLRLPVSLLARSQERPPGPKALAGRPLVRRLKPTAPRRQAGTPRGKGSPPSTRTVAAAETGTRRGAAGR